MRTDEGGGASTPVSSSFVDFVATAADGGWTEVGRSGRDRSNSGRSVPFVVGAGVSATVLARRTKRTALPEVTMEDLTHPDGDRQTDSTSFGHLQLQQQRQLLYYMRLIEYEMPQLVGGYPA